MTLLACKKIHLKLVGVFFHCFFVCCCPGSRQGNTEQVATRWWHPRASNIALDMLHWEMHFVLHRRITTAIKLAGRQGALFPIIHLCLNINAVAKQPCYSLLKLKTSYTNVHYYVYCYFVPYWLPPLAMDTILATIIAGGQAQLENTQSLIEIN